MSKKPKNTGINKVALLTIAGYAGKSTIAAHVIMPRLEGAAHLAIETTNGDTAPSKNKIDLTAQDIEFIQAKLIMEKRVVLDIGSSDAMELLENMKLFHGAVQDIDLFIIPTTVGIGKKENKPEIDTIMTVEALLEMDVLPSKIKAVYNLVKPKTNLELESSKLRMTLGDLGVEVCSHYIPETPFVGMANDAGLTVNEILQDKTNYMQALQEGSDLGDDKKKLLLEKLSLSRLAITTKDIFDGVATELGL